MPTISCTSAETVINQAGAFGCKSPNQQKLATLGYLAAIAEGVGNSPAGVYANSSNGVKSGAGTAVLDNLNRTDVQIQNQGTNVLYVKFGTGCTTTNYDVTLAACTVAADGKGALYSNTGYTGSISVAGTSPSYTITEFVAAP
jgi:hypothetical protein